MLISLLSFRLFCLKYFPGFRHGAISELSLGLVSSPLHTKVLSLGETQWGLDIHPADWLAIAWNEYFSWWLVSEVAPAISLRDLAFSSLISNLVISWFVSSPSQTAVWFLDDPGWCFEQDTMEAPTPTPMIWLVEWCALFFLQPDASVDTIASSCTGWRGVTPPLQNEAPWCGKLKLKQTINWLSLPGGLENEPKHCSDNTTICCVADLICLACWHYFIAMLVLTMASCVSPSQWDIASD